MFENREIIGIDHGNRNMKTAGTVFSAAVQPVQTKPDSLENILEYQNRFYYIGGQVPVMERVDKTENEDYYLLTLAALAKELKCRNRTCANVKMGAALPPRRFQFQKEGFRKYLFKTKELHFRYEGIHYHVTLENVYVFMQGHVVIHGRLFHKISEQSVRTGASHGEGRNHACLPGRCGQCCDWKRRGYLPVCSGHPDDSGIQ